MTEVTSFLDGVLVRYRGPEGFAFDLDYPVVYTTEPGVDGSHPGFVLPQDAFFKTLRAPFDDTPSQDRVEIAFEALLDQAEDEMTSALGDPATLAEHFESEGIRFLEDGLPVLTGQ